MAYSDNFPQRPVFMADFANGGKIDPRASYTRSTTGTYFGREKVLSSENLLLQSQSFDSSSWTKFQLTESGSQTAPGSSSTASLLTPDSGSAITPFLVQTITIAASTEYTLTVHVKAGGASDAFMSLRGGVGGHYAYANLDFSSPSSVTTGGAGFTGISGTVSALGSGWYRVSLTATSDSESSSPRVFIQPSDGSAPQSNATVSWSPTGAETLYVWGAQLNTTGATVYDSPTTTQIARSYQTKLQTAAINAPRFEYSTDGESAGTSLGILIEGQAQNLAGSSEDFTNGAYTKLDLNVSANAGVAPDGTLTADLLYENTDTDFHYIYRTIATGLSTGSGAANTYAYSVFLKSAGQRYAKLYDGNQSGSNRASTVFDLQLGTHDNTTGKASIESCGNGWWRCTVMPTCDTNSTGGLHLMLGQGTPYAGNGYNGILAWGFQVENGNNSGTSFSSSYIGTTTVAVTRAADSLSMVDSNLFDNGGASIVMEVENTGRSYIAAVLEDDSTGNYQDYVALTVRADDKARQSVNAPGTSSQSDLFSAASTVDGSYFKIASRFSPNDFGVCIDGGTVATDTSGAVPSNVDKLFIGYYDDGGNANAHIKRVAVYPPLSDTNLQAITS